MLTDYVVAFLICKMERIWGKVALQKLLYFVKESGVPIECNFGMHIFGPFSIEVANSYNLWKAKGIFTEEFTSSGFCFVKGNQCEKYKGSGNRLLKQYMVKLEEVVNNFGKLRPLELELNATVHFINKRLKESYGETNKENVINEVINEKGEKFTKKEVRDSYEKLEKLSMV